MEIREQLQRTLGHAAYTLERELGGGGMSQVFVAEETALGRMVVVKVLPADRVKAVEHYRKVIEHWKDADPGLQVIVEDLQRRVDRLSDLEKIPR